MPTFDVRVTHYLRAVGVAVGLTIAGSILWWAISLAFLIIMPGVLPALLTSLIAVPLGYVAGDLISRSVNRKRSNGLAWLAGSSVVLAVVIGLQLPGTSFSPFYGLLATAAGVYLAVQPLRRTHPTLPRKPIPREPSVRSRV